MILVPKTDKAIDFFNQFDGKLKDAVVKKTIDGNFHLIFKSRRGWFINSMPRDFRVKALSAIFDDEGIKYNIDYEVL
jgi:hypothetical protein